MTATLIMALCGGATAQEHKHGGDHALGSVNFAVGCNVEAQKRVNTAVAMLHSFWFQEARKTFESAAQADPRCGVAYWGVALTHFGNPFAGGPGPEANQAGLAAAQKAVAIGGTTTRDKAYIDAALTLYQNYETVDNRTRMKAYEAALGKLHAANAADEESAIFHGIWLVATASPLDMTFAQQKQAADMLNPLFQKNPRHPGLAHYIIHAFDSPPLAKHALAAARRYADIAPDAPHALHMPSHTFTRLGYWDESIKTNRKSADLEPTRGAKAHAADYMVYAYLQKGEDDAARAVLGEIGIDPAGTDPTGIAGLGGYNALAMPARFALERNDWAMAAALPVLTNQPPFVQAVTRFARALGKARSNDAAAARAELNEMNALVEKLTAAKDPYWPIVVDAQRMAAEAWVLHAEAKHADALRVAAEGADKEELVEKHPVTPGPLIPARELLGDILMVHGKPADALIAYEKTLEREPNRLRTLYGAAKAAAAAGQKDVARKYYSEVVKLLAPDTKRSELAEAKAFLKSD
ncbi:MAG: tetratricopeptide repeat protein [Gemmatimonadota bacterium]